MMLIGLGAANVVGVPLTTMLGQNVGWQAPYWVVGGIGVVTVARALGLGAVAAARRRRLDARGADGAHPPPGVAGPAHRRGRVRRDVRDVLLHRADDDRAVAVPGGVRARRARDLRRRHGQRHGRLRPGRPPRRAPRDHRRAQRDRGDAGHLRLARPHPGARPGHGVRAGVPAVDPRARCCRPGSWTSPRTASRWPPRSTTRRSTSPTRSARGWAASCLSAGLGYEWPSRVGAILAVAGVGIAVLSAMLGRRSARRS